MSFTDEETLLWIKGKLAHAGLLSATNRDVYGSMHILASDRQGMEAYIRAYKCDHKQGVIANLTAALHVAVDTIDRLGGDSSDLRSIMEASDTILKASTEG